jgi:hypothetical protein
VCHLLAEAEPAVYVSLSVPSIGTRFQQKSTARYRGLTDALLAQAAQWFAGIWEQRSTWIPFSPSLFLCVFALRGLWSEFPIQTLTTNSHQACDAQKLGSPAEPPAIFAISPCLDLPVCSTLRFPQPFLSLLAVDTCPVRLQRPRLSQEDIQQKPGSKGKRNPETRSRTQNMPAIWQRSTSRGDVGGAGRFHHCPWIPCYEYSMTATATAIPEEDRAGPDHAHLDRQAGSTPRQHQDFLPSSLSI